MLNDEREGVASPITLENVVRQMENWRTTKKSASEPIPEAIWQQIIVLAKTIPPVDIRRATAIGNKQWNRRFAKKGGTTLKKPERQPSVSIASPPALLRPAKTEAATDRVVVELCRPDGRIMKIHATPGTLAELMTAFFVEK